MLWLQPLQAQTSSMQGLQPLINRDSPCKLLPEHQTYEHKHIQSGKGKRKLVI